MRTMQRTSNASRSHLMMRGSCSGGVVIAAQAAKAFPFDAHRAGSRRCSCRSTKRSFVGTGEWRRKSGIGMMKKTMIMKSKETNAVKIEEARATAARLDRVSRRAAVDPDAAEMEADWRCRHANIPIGAFQ